MARQLIIMQGASGSGKSTFVSDRKHLNDVVLSTDDYYWDEDGTYTFRDVYITKFRVLRNPDGPMRHQLRLSLGLLHGAQAFLHPRQVECILIEHSGKVAELWSVFSPAILRT